ncbi:MAG TPA: hypothetical protein VM241_07055 [Candidatus Thermoplasmatota archaeon]|nr:hypothetical protein [Candidatus Thermoplasmatota archaeon]
MAGRLPLAAACLLVLAGCAQQQAHGGAAQPYDQTAVSNQTDQFVFSGQASQKEGTQDYTWHVTTASAQVTWSGQVSAGAVDLTVRDTLGRTLYTHTFSAPPQSGVHEATPSTVPGDWKVTLAFHAFAGSMGLVLQAR